MIMWHTRAAAAAVAGAGQRQIGDLFSGTLFTYRITTQERGQKKRRI
jgi:hypothetical protein